MTNETAGLIGAIISAVIIFTTLSFQVWYQCGGYWTLKGIWTRLIEKIKTGKGKVF